MTERGARLLIADDNKVNRLLMSRSVELQGHRTALAENGRIALEKLRAEPFDLLLLDIEMPELDGFGVLEQLKADPALRDIPVIVTSSLEGLDNIVRCIGLGAEDYLPKPVNAVLLKARIGASLEKKRLRDEQRELVRRFRRQAIEIPKCTGVLQIRLGVSLVGMHHVRKLEGVPNEKDRCVVAHQVVVPLLGVKLQGKATGIPLGIRTAPLTAHGGETGERFSLPAHLP